MAESGKAPYLFALVLLLAVLGVYLPGLNNELLFDDLRLTEGSIFGVYGNLLDVKQRMISYGSFVWVEHLVGAGWWKQRIVNLALHLGVVAAVYVFFKALLASTRFPQDMEEQAHFASSQRVAWYAGALLSYLLAVLSKEHAVMTIALAVPLYIHVRRPSWKKAVAVTGGALLLLALVAAVLLHFYGAVMGRLFDAQSVAFAQQLEALQP